MEFEFDDNKSQSNKSKHRIDFTEAQQLWDDPELLEIPASDTDEPRFIVIGKIPRKFWSAVITYRDSKIRIISVRRSRKQEIQLYEGQDI